jgi:hypothetical protein
MRQKPDAPIKRQYRYHAMYETAQIDDKGTSKSATLDTWTRMLDAKWFQNFKPRS